MSSGIPPGPGNHPVSAESAISKKPRISVMIRRVRLRLGVFMLKTV